ncbi:alpha/beta-hydrolase [Eremomyces bilateralis CBS 781.70]|uniref:Alpha/beta-hydrolase n=1 Tax=Eremomyces bilateralis CBS 781.70 TaxID=1392243 RepID=A0A6G1FVQ8_9PEZI|nr:alpha/beta-hydrolase [Eremomyces bilateralis CBS 781.70]KAF1809985.1 alpha/beta-hydrolase [Eremomyces bilateralis CBS 781.70]
MSDKDSISGTIPTVPFQRTITLEPRSSRAEITVYANFTPPQDPSHTTLLLLHGNSSHSRIFAPLLSTLHSPLPCSLLLLDLPGHGASTNSPDPTTYTMPGYACDVLDVLNHPGIHVQNLIIFGWSLGGHIAIELIPLLGPRLKGLMLVGTPPALGAEQTVRAFTRGNPHMAAAGKAELTEEEIQAYGHETCGPPRREWLVDAVRRTDGRARATMFDAFNAGRGIDQRKAVAEWTGLTAVVNGGEEPFVDLGYLDGCAWGNLWGGKCHRMERLGHAPFWEDPERFVPYLVGFVEDCLKD